MDITQSLNGEWDLWFGPYEGKPPEGREEAAALGYRRIAARVPGNVELDLQRAGLADDPFYSDRVLDFEQYEQYAWLFERTFAADPAGKGRRAALVLHGINTYADIYVNGERAGETDNMLIPHEIDVTHLIKWEGDNTLGVSIRPAMAEARKKPLTAAQRGTGGCDEITMLRMPAHSFGWDIMPRLLSAGLWRDVELSYRGGERLTDVYLYTRSAAPEEARLELWYAFESDRVRLPVYAVRIEGRCGDSGFSAEGHTHFVSNGLSVTVPRPRLWWPAGYGDAPLYDVAVTLLRDGEAVDRREFRFGIRTAALEACFEPGKEKFVFLVNGEKIFIRGSNWVPLSALHSLDAERTDRAVGLLAATGANAARCWGGNVYESDRFYDLCDEKGILVWQDFSMACVIPPQDDGFAAGMEREAAAVIRRLRNHPSIVLWAGDNEIDAAYGWHGYRGHARHNRVTRDVLPRACARHDPARAYLPSSPYVPEDAPEGYAGPEQHLWGPRDDYKGDFYRLNTAAFASEIGYHGCPAVSSLRRFISPGQLWPNADSRDWLVHNSEHPRYPRGYDRNDLMAKQAGMLFGKVPASLGDFAFASQFSQAEAKKYFIELFRMRKWEKTGILWWNLLDGWPQVSDAVVDYYWRAKLAYHVIGRCQRSVSFMMEDYRDWGYAVWGVNDTLAGVSAHLRIEDGETGEVFLEKDCAIPRNGRAEAGSVKANPADKRLYILSWTVGGETFHNHFIAGRAPFDLEKAREWTRLLAVLPPAFDAEACWR